MRVEFREVAEADSYCPLAATLQDGEREGPFGVARQGPSATQRRQHGELTGLQVAADAGMMFEAHTIQQQMAGAWRLEAANPRQSAAELSGGISFCPDRGACVRRP